MLDYAHERGIDVAMAVAEHLPFVNGAFDSAKLCSESQPPGSGIRATDPVGWWEPPARVGLWGAGGLSFEAVDWSRGIDHGYTR